MRTIGSYVAQVFIACAILDRYIIPVAVRSPAVGMEYCCICKVLVVAALEASSIHSQVEEILLTHEGILTQEMHCLRPSLLCIDIVYSTVGRDVEWITEGDNSFLLVESRHVHYSPSH